MANTQNQSYNEKVAELQEKRRTRQQKKGIQEVGNYLGELLEKAEQVESRSAPLMNRTGDFLLDPNDLYNQVISQFSSLLPPKSDLIIDGNFKEIAQSVIIDIYTSHYKSISQGNSYLKGVCLAGPYGLGKTLLVEASRNVISNHNIGGFKLASCHSIYLEVKRKGIEAIDQYIEAKHCFFDDIGQEGNINDYGTFLELMTSIINERYNLFRKKPSITHFTTNLTAKELETAYGGHTYSRMKQMCNFYLIRGEDKR